ncbi:hypothetical protein [Vreelandella titanicae]|uniref:hypothetical protein n=1 Tax=Vreelandella titanicae TaxID=664683 RepID=UPI003824BADA
MADKSANELPWFERRMLTTDFQEISGIPQKHFLDLIKRWHRRTFKSSLTNDEIGLLTLVNRKAVEAWRAPVGSISYRSMSDQARLLLIYRLIEPLKAFDDQPPRIRGPQIEWSDSDDDAVVKYYSDFGAAYVSRLTGKADYSVRRRARVLGITSSLPQAESHGFRWNKENDPELIRLVNSGVKIADIAKHFGTSNNTIVSHKLRLGLKSRRGRPKKPRD